MEKLSVLRAGDKGALSVGTSILRVGGASSGTGATTNGGRCRYVDVTNCSLLPDDYLFLIPVLNADSLAGVDETSFAIAVPPGQTVKNIELMAGEDLAAVRGASSVASNLYYREKLSII